MVDALVRQRQRLSVEAEVVDRHLTGGDALCCELAPGFRRIHGQDSRDAGRVVLDVESGAEADFQHLTAEPGRDPSACFRQLATAHEHIHDPRQHLIAVEAHRASMCAEHTTVTLFAVRPRDAATPCD